MPLEHYIVNINAAQTFETSCIQSLRYILDTLGNITSAKCGPPLSVLG